ncbi:MAG: hypothetical protein PHU64_02555 [Candidatus Omnitrophica bacterium]|nr:hypothetical protein [Candidatus Omnitrophota bacterium]MDD5429402.1 hypothetical protein [Candidatus Omnitrophota bacterium]
MLKAETSLFPQFRLQNFFKAFLASGKQKKIKINMPQIIENITPETEFIPVPAGFPMSMKSRENIRYWFGIYSFSLSSLTH